MKTQAATKSSSKPCDTGFARKGHLLALRPANSRIITPLLIAKEWWSAKDCHKLRSGRIVKGYQFHAASVTVQITGGVNRSRNSALKAIRRSRDSEIGLSERPEGKDWSSTILEMLGLGRALHSTPGSNLAELLGTDSHASPGQTLASSFLAMLGMDAATLTRNIFGSEEQISLLDGVGGSRFDRQRIEMKTGSGMKSGLEPSYTHEDFWKEYEEDVEDDMALDYMEWEDEKGWPDPDAPDPYQPTDDIDKILPPFSPPEEDPPTDDDGTVEDSGDGRDGLDRDPGPGGTVQVLRLLGGGVTDPQPDGDNGSNTVSSFVSLRFLGGGITDPAPGEEGSGTSGTSLSKILARGGFTDPSPLRISVAAGSIHVQS